MVNRKIVEIECRKHNIVATDAEVEDRFKKDFKGFNASLTEEEFTNTILRRFGKTMVEWKEDVVRPKIMIEVFRHHIPRFEQWLTLNRYRVAHRIEYVHAVNFMIEPANG